MPIKKRGGGFVKLSKNPKPQPSRTKPAKKKTITPKKAWNTKLTTVKRRKSSSSRYVYLDGGILVVKTPAECTNWPTEFRKHLIGGYIAPRTLRPLSEYKDTERAPHIYKIGGQLLSVSHPFEDVGVGQAVVLCTRINNHTTKKSLFLNHPDPAMRVLMVYAFLHDAQIGGVPKLIIDDIA